MKQLLKVVWKSHWRWYEVAMRAAIEGGMEQLLKIV